MKIHSYSSKGYDGELIEIEINNFSRSLPGIEIVGLPGNAVRESKVRVRSSILNSGYDFPKGRIILNMAPAGERKEGAEFDLAFACSVIKGGLDVKVDSIMVLGELTLAGAVRGIKGVLPAIYKGKSCGINKFIVPFDNKEEAGLLGYGEVYPVKSLKEAAKVIEGKSEPFLCTTKPKTKNKKILDFSDIIGLENAKRGIEIAVAGGHNILIFGPPGIGKSMILNRIEGILPSLPLDKAIESSMIWSLSGNAKSDEILIESPPIRKPHHGASFEGIIGGGSNCLPGEISLAHNGFLILDELPEFKTNIIQSLREPLEDKRISLNRAKVSTWYPADFQIVASANPCPCGNLGKDNAVCFCSEKEIKRYWKKIGGAIMDRIDIRIPVNGSNDLFKAETETTEMIKYRVLMAVDIQDNRYINKCYKRNAKIEAGDIDEICVMTDLAKSFLISGIKKLSLSSRGVHSVLKIGRTIADLDSTELIDKKHIVEALSFRRYGDEDLYFI